MSSSVNNANKVPANTISRWIIAAIVVLLAVWILGLIGVIHLAMPLVWLLPFTCLVLGAFVILWEGGIFDQR